MIGRPSWPIVARFLEATKTCGICDRSVRTRHGRCRIMKINHAVGPDDRMKLLVAERNRKMAASAHAYVRGSTTRFYAWLEASTRLALPDGP